MTVRKDRADILRLHAPEIVCFRATGRSWWCPRTTRWIHGKALLVPGHRRGGRGSTIGAFRVAVRLQQISGACLWSTPPVARAASGAVGCTHSYGPCMEQLSDATTIAYLWADLVLLRHLTLEISAPHQVEWPHTSSRATGSSPGSSAWCRGRHKSPPIRQVQRLARLGGKLYGNIHSIVAAPTHLRLF